MARGGNQPLNLLLQFLFGLFGFSFSRYSFTGGFDTVIHFPEYHCQEENTQSWTRTITRILPDTNGTQPEDVKTPITQLVRPLPKAVKDN